VKPQVLEGKLSSLKSSCFTSLVLGCGCACGDGSQSHAVTLPIACACLHHGVSKLQRVDMRPTVYHGIADDELMRQAQLRQRQMRSRTADVCAATVLPFLCLFSSVLAAPALHAHYLLSLSLPRSVAAGVAVVYRHSCGALGLPPMSLLLLSSPKTHVTLPRTDVACCVAVHAVIDCGDRSYLATVSFRCFSAHQPLASISMRLPLNQCRAMPRRHRTGMNRARRRRRVLRYAAFVSSACVVGFFAVQGVRCRRRQRLLSKTFRAWPIALCDSCRSLPKLLQAVRMQAPSPMNEVFERMPRGERKCTPATCIHGMHFITMNNGGTSSVALAGVSDIQRRQMKLHRKLP
jgi:hypothetical protein